ncbi:MAG: hypothetical protein ACE5KE_06930 [Methanosarcinales archaeon]
MKHDHVSCGILDKDWLPYYDVNRAINNLKPHPYCIHCGFVKNISPDRAKKIGYYINALSKMKKYLSKVQIRLIVKELESIEDFEDTYWRTGFSQKKIFINIVKKYSNLSEELIQSYL